MERKEVDSERSHTKSDSEVKELQVLYMKKMHSLSLNSLLMCKHIRSSSQQNDTWMNLHHHTLAK